MKAKSCHQLNTETRLTILKSDGVLSFQMFHTCTFYTATNLRHCGKNRQNYLTNVNFHVVHAQVALCLLVVVKLVKMSGRDQGGLQYMRRKLSNLHSSSSQWQLANAGPPGIT